MEIRIWRALSSAKSESAAHVVTGLLWECFGCHTSANHAAVSSAQLPACKPDLSFTCLGYHPGNSAFSSTRTQLLSPHAGISSADSGIDSASQSHKPRSLMHRRPDKAIQPELRYNVATRRNTYIGTPFDLHSQRSFQHKKGFCAGRLVRHSASLYCEMRWSSVPGSGFRQPITDESTIWPPNAEVAAAGRSRL